LPLPWLAPVLAQALGTSRSHALLLHGPQGVGQFDLATTIAQAWLCESDAATARPCGHCGSCRLVQARTHPDLLVVLPESLQAELGWGALAEDAPAASGKAKPSKDIKVESVRVAVSFVQTTSARGRAKVVVFYPAQRMNTISANTLLKTLEEPPGTARFVLACAELQSLLPTIRSRCQQLAMPLPSHDAAVAWLESQGVEQPQVLLTATGGQAQLALDWHRQGLDARTWSGLPDLLRQGRAAGTLGPWPVARVVDALLKLCHDLLRVAAGAAPRYFAASALTAPSDTRALWAWHHELQRVARHAEHPWSAALLVESLTRQGQRACAGPRLDPPVRNPASLHSTP
jgi:DNA polymerase-3 subunit delta'